jgi:predicted nucleic acid-binding protein
MNAFFDSSAFAKRFIEEKGSEEVDEICRAIDRLALSSICVPEIISALNRRVREKKVSKADYLTIKARLLDDVRDVEVVNLTDDVVAHSMLILEQNPVRAMDSLHIACSLAWTTYVFVTADVDQAKAAQRNGLKCRFIS